MDIDGTLGELESIITAIESANTKLSTIKRSLSDTAFKGDLFDDAEIAISLATIKLHRLRMVCRAERAKPGEVDV